jgi:hypothetical protein
LLGSNSVCMSQRTLNNRDCVLCGPCCNAVLGKHVQTNTRPTMQERCFYVVIAEIITRQQSARQWTGWVAITWKPQQTRTQQWKSCVFSAWSAPRGYKSKRKWRRDSDQRRITADSLANDRPVLSSEIAPHINKPATV